MEPLTPLYLAADHAGYELKEQLKNWLKDKSYPVRDFGTNSPESMDYPDVVHPLAEALAETPQALGLVMCGSGNGVNMTANKYGHIRSAMAWEPELARLARAHNNANVLALSARFLEADKARDIVLAFLNEPFEGGRHQRRVDKIAEKPEPAES